MPAVIAPSLANVAVVIENAPPESDPDLYGRYEGQPLNNRSDGGDLPARIVIFMRPLVEDCVDDDELRQEIQITVLHEIGRHLGMDDDQLERLGYG